eukprot:7268479-Prymnesium_polylepis.1
MWPRTCGKCQERLNVLHDGLWPMMRPGAVSDAGVRDSGGGQAKLRPKLTNVGGPRSTDSRKWR